MQYWRTWRGERDTETHTTNETYSSNSIVPRSIGPSSIKEGEQSQSQNTPYVNLRTGEEFRIPPPLPENAFREEEFAVWNSHGAQDSSLVSFVTAINPNFISYQKATHLGFSPLDLPEREWMLYRTPNGHVNLATQFITLNIEIKTLKRPRVLCYLLVVDSSEIEITLGFHFLSQYNILQNLVGEWSSRPTASAILTKPTPGTSF
jgi:hypothetical protein